MQLVFHGSPHNNKVMFRASVILDASVLARLRRHQRTTLGRTAGNAAVATRPQTRLTLDLPMLGRSSGFSAFRSCIVILTSCRPAAALRIRRRRRRRVRHYRAGLEIPDRGTDSKHTLGPAPRIKGHNLLLRGMVLRHPLVELLDLFRLVRNDLLRHRLHLRILAVPELCFRHVDTGLVM